MEDDTKEKVKVKRNKDAVKKRRESDIWAQGKYKDSKNKYQDCFRASFSFGAFYASQEMD